MNAKRRKCPSGTRKSKTGKTCRRKKRVTKSKKGWGRSYGY